MAEATISAAGLRVIRLLVGNRPQTITELIRATGVTRTAVSEQLNELVAGGFVDRTIEKLPGRGRPRHLYVATDASLLLLFASNQHLVVPAMWRAIEEVAGPEMMKKIHKRVGRLLAEHYSTKITAKEPKERLQRFVDLLREEGGLLEVTYRDGQLMLYKRSCPFISMADENRTICTVDSDMMAAVVGRPVRRIACRHEGAPCCTFEIDADA